MGEFLKNFKKLNNFGNSQKKRIVANIIINIFTIIISVVSPLLSARMIVKLTNNELLQLVYLAIVFIGIRIFSNTLSFFLRGNYHKIYRENYIELQSKLGREILKLDNNTLDQNGTGLFIQRLTGDAGRLSDIYGVLINDTSMIISNLGVFAAIFVVNKYAFILSVVETAILGLIYRTRVKKFNELDKVARKKNEKITSFIGEIVRGARDIKMLNSEESFMTELHNKSVDYNDIRYQMNYNNRKYSLITDITYWVGYLLFILLIVYLIYKGKLVIAEGLVLYNYIGRTEGLIYNIGDMYNFIKDFNLSFKRVFDIFDSNEFNKEKFGKEHIDDIKGNFEFRHLYFSYKDKKVLKNISFKIKSGETVAFVGKSGAGKTTIFNLLCKMYDVPNSKIFIDGKDINKLDKYSIRNNITIISQSPYIFNLSIRDNLRLVKDDLTEEEMKEACKTACLSEFIEELPDGYDTVIGEGGVNLSGGQKQRLAIARALIQKTQIILFDEATSALDNETQSKIQEAIENMKGEYTILIIAHRLSTIINSDRILFLNDGKIEAEGSHEELLDTCEDYKKLYKSEIKNNK